MTNWTRSRARSRIAAAAGLLRDTWYEWTADRAPRLGAALAYYAVFSLAPLLAVAVAIAGLVFKRQDVHAQLIAEIGRRIGPDGAAAIAAMIQHAITPASSIWAAVMSVSVMLVAASGAFAELQQGLNEIWKVESRREQGIVHTIRKRCVSFLIVLGVGAWFLVSLIVNAALATLDRWSGSAPVLQLLLEVIHFSAALGLGTLLFAMLFKWLPDVRIAWRDVWVGAATVSLLLAFGQSLIALYLAHSAVSSAFGAAGSLVIILVWVYYSSQIFFLGAELTRVYARRYGSHVAVQRTGASVGPGPAPSPYVAALPWRVARRTGRRITRR